MTTMPVIPPVSFQDFLDHADTGDVVIFSGSADVSQVIELLSGGEFSHTAMVVVDPATKDKYLWQAVSEELEADPLYPGGGKHSGAQLGPLKLAMIDVVNYHDAPTWRQLQYVRPNGFDAAVWTAIAPLDARPFPDLPTLGANYISGLFLNEAENDGPMFCSQLVAYTLQQVGLLDPSRVANSYAPSDFSSDPRPRPAVLLEGSFSPDQPIDLQPAS